MRPQLKLFLVATIVLLAATAATADFFLPHSSIRDQMREAVRCKNNHSCDQQSKLRLASHVVQLSNANLLALRENVFPEQQVTCQKAIVKGSASYVSRWVQAIEAGKTPEWADQFASRQLDSVSTTCNIPVLTDASGVMMPAAGGPCAPLTNQPYTTVNAEELRVCLQRTLEFWTSYLYIPEQQ